ncbi:hypothetical protein DC083_02850 [Ignatzschineria ureiclastica]|uniref:Uncharacterized protein n=1 Tax=Ignatzschineria ureiclastica TaxID=472582 RepID=A0A2U2AFI1_9GAMM|nr:hypothetical protein [Ignatzschineria ureiclastica]PWD81406.1 hypothetical protein DC083_02850 [Ignatzschineria ureiclastica]GHA00555.1 hypothetical protein GCM10007162_15760 [Ignatzschineria ureiclastica]
MPHSEKDKTADHLYPSSDYDYDGIAGTWLAIPPVFHLGFGVVALAVLIFLLPSINFRGPLKYLFTDYQVPIGIGIALFFIASALLSKLKSYQVSHKTRKKPTKTKSANRAKVSHNKKANR